MFWIDFMEFFFSSLELYRNMNIIEWYFLICFFLFFEVQKILIEKQLLALKCRILNICMHDQFKNINIISIVLMTSSILFLYDAKYDYSFQKYKSYFIELSRSLRLFSIDPSELNFFIVFFFIDWCDSPMSECPDYGMQV